MIIALANQKGGVGKTSVAALLTQVISSDILLIDADPQANLTQWCYGYLSGDAATESFQKMRKHNLMSVLENDSSIRQARIPITKKISLVGATVALDKSRTEFVEMAGAQLFLRAAIEDFQESLEPSENEPTIIIDTAGELSLLSMMGIACAEKVVIPIGTQLLPIDSLSITLQRLGQAQSRLNPRLKDIVVLPTLFNPKRTTNVSSLNVLESEYGQLLPRYLDGSAIVIHNRAEVEALLHSQQNLPKNSQAREAMNAFVSTLNLLA